MTLLPHYPHKPSHLIPKLKIALRGQTLLNSPRFNKGTAFSPRERKALGLTGRIPYHINTLEQQVARAYDQLSTRDTPIRKNTFLASLKDQNWVLYYSLVGKHLRELVPVIYTPTQGDAIANYSHLYRKPEGLFLTYASQHTMEEAFDEATRGREIDLVVVTDSEAILGIGDQGVGGIGISTAKAAMYTLIGGIDPSRCLPVVLDVGTDNKALLEDPLYVGWVHERVRGEGYDAFVDKFVQLVRKKYPNSLLHFEDFGTNNAYRLLHKYKNSHAAFNDDIQGTGAVTLACLLAAISISSHTSHTTPSVQSPQPNRLSAQRIVIFGAGSAGMGIAVQVRDAMLTADGVSRSTANRCFYLVDKDGLLYEGGPSSSSSSSSTSPSATIENPEWLKARTEFVRPSSEGWSGHISLSDLVNAVKPTILIGCSTVPGAFTEEIIRSMASGLVNGEKPIVMPLSNPSRLVEAKPEDIMHWTDGRALVATGSPFPDVRMEVEGEERVFQYVIFLLVFGLISLV
ncbi:malate dehydrogenase, variant 4 [Coprinopsis cinerea AmutBmut pab1-1]|nr:malate dehydrogenase, variant 4 [Coprinopsis cinerea AmutBmut pab1-1]